MLDELDSEEVLVPPEVDSAELELVGLELLDAAELELVVDAMVVLSVGCAVDDAAVVVEVAPEEVVVLLVVPVDESEVVSMDGDPGSVDAQATRRETPSATTLANICRPCGALVS